MIDKKKKPIIYVGVPILLLSMFMFGYAFSIASPSITQSSDSSFSNGMKREGFVCVQTTGEFSGRDTPAHKGINEIVDCGHNLVVNAGLNATRDILGRGISYGNFTAIALVNASNATGAAAVAATDSALSGEYTSNGLNRQYGNYGTLGIGNWSVYLTFQSTGIAGLTTNKSCLFNQTTVAGSTMLACVNFNQVTLDGSALDTITVNWTNWVSSG